MSNVPGAAAAVAGDPAAERARRLADAQLRRKSGRGKPFRFVMLTLLVWWMVSVVADLVITCVPGGAACRAPYLISRVFALGEAIRSVSLPSASVAVPVHLSRYEWPLLLISLIAALWVAKATVYPDTDATAEFTEEELDGKA